MIVGIPSVQHTGTNFVRGHLFESFGKIEINEPVSDRRGDYVYQAHLLDGYMGYWLEILKTIPAIIPLRHPYLVWASWKKWDMKGYRERDNDAFMDAWNTLIGKIDCFKPYYLPIDSPDRDNYLEAINNGLNLDLKTDWPVVHSVGNTWNLEPDDIDVDVEVVDFVNRNSGFFNRFYAL